MKTTQTTRILETAAKLAARTLRNLRKAETDQATREHLAAAAEELEAGLAHAALAEVYAAQALRGTQGREALALVEEALATLADGFDALEDLAVEEAVAA